MNTNISFWSYLTQFFLEREMLHKKLVEKITTHILFSVKIAPPPRKSYGLWHKVENFCRAGQATNKKMAHAPCILDT